MEPLPLAALRWFGLGGLFDIQIEILAGRRMEMLHHTIPTFHRLNPIKGNCWNSCDLHA